MDTFQALSLDGGGIKGLFAASVLAEIEADLGVRLIDHFDLIVGTSTGGLIALALGLGLSAAEISEFYLSEGPAIFGSGRRWGRLFRSKHDGTELHFALSKIFGDKVLADSSKRLVIPSYSLDANDVYLFKTPHHHRLTRDWKEKVVDVAMATTAAPTFFPSFRLRNNRLIDGGIWANNPALLAVTEARSMLGVELSQMRVLSLGTTSGLSDLGPKLTNGGFLAWMGAGPALLLRAPSVGCFHVVEHLLGKDRVVRIDPVVPDGLFALDRADVGRIRGLAEDVARRESPRVKSFTAHIAPKFVPKIPAEFA